MDFLIAKDDLHRCRFDDDPAPQPGDGQALLRIETFGLTSNNITYATFGEAMSYWSFFPAEDGCGRMPVWGFAEVLDSAVAELEPGTRGRLAAVCAVDRRLAEGRPRSRTRCAAEGQPRRARRSHRPGERACALARALNLPTAGARACRCSRR
jgi:hypothetical protein